MSALSPQPSACPAVLFLPDQRQVTGYAACSSQGDDIRFTLVTDGLAVTPRTACTLRLGTMTTPDYVALQETVAVSPGAATGELLLRAPHENVLVRECLLARLALQERGITVESALARTRQIANATLDDLLREFLPALSDHLFDLSSRPHRRLSRDALHAGMTTVRKRGGQIRVGLLDCLEEYYADYLPSPELLRKQDRDEYDLENLGLVDLAEFEEHLAIERIIRTGEATHEDALEQLALRVAVLLGVNPLALRLPIHVAQICTAFRTAINQLELASDVVIEVQDFFAANVIDQLDTVYDKLNAYFAQELGIFPDLEKRLGNDGSLLAKIRMQQNPRPVRDRSSTVPQPAPETEALDDSLSLNLEQAHSAVQRESGGRTAKTQALPADGDGWLSGPTQPLASDSAQERHVGTNPDALYAAVVRALDLQNPPLVTAAGGVTAGASASKAPPADARTLTAALSELQSDDTLAALLRQGTTLTDYLKSDAGRVQALTGTQGFDHESFTQIALVDRLFGTLRTDLRAAPPLEDSLGALQIPLARLALHEPQFFVERDHAARNVIDKLAELSAAANYPNRLLETRVRDIIERIVTNYRDDSSVFESALEEIDKLVDRQKRALARNVERVSKTYQGQERLQQAQQAANQALRARVRPPRAPRVLVELVDGGWRELLVLSHLKEGAGGKLWRACIKALDVLSLWLLAEQHGQNPSRREHLRKEAAATIVAMEQQQLFSLPANVGLAPVFVELREILAGLRPVSTVHVLAADGRPQPKPEVVRERIEQLPRLRRWVRRVEELRTGTWLSYRDAQGHRRRMQLAWISGARDRYIFVDERGQKHADMTAVQLARQLSKGVKPPTPSEQLSLVDQSMYDTLEQLQQKLSFTRNYDRLTQLINADTLRRQLERALVHSRRRHSHHALLYIDIDKFSLVNEMYESQAGDDVLVEFSRLFAQIHDSRMSSARIRDDEFALLMLNCRLADAAALAEKLVADVAASAIEIDGEPVSFTISVGVAPVVEYLASADDVLANAQSAMRQVKRDGGNGVSVFRESANLRAELEQQRAEAENLIAMTLETERFVLQAQPIYRTSHWGEKNARPAAYEVLLRIRSDAGDLVSPTDFISVAEQYGYMKQVDRWVVNATFEWINSQVDAGREVPLLSMNISGNSVSDDSFLEYLLEQISEHGVGTNLLCFEITEAGTISNMVKASDFVRTFRNIGCKFSVDDFGTNVDSHNYLRELPVDFVKIDGSLISGIETDADSLAMTRSINDLAHFMGQQTIAEFVESDPVIGQLRDLGVDLLQGWGIGRPQALDVLANELDMVKT